jgi:hypothetical protein
MQIFLSFAYDEDIEQVNGFRGMLENPNANINFVDGSCKKNYQGKPDNQIDQYIRGLINRSSVTVCLLSGKTRNSRWVNRELELSRSIQKGIVGIVLKGKDNEVSHISQCPPILDGSRYKVFTWGTPEAMSARIQEAERRR